MTGAAVRRALAIAGVGIRRFFRDRTNLFFSFVFPIALVLVIGLQDAGDRDARLAVAGAEGDVARAVLDRLDYVEVVDAAAEDLAERVGDGSADAGVAFPADLDTAVADANAGRSAPGADPVDVVFVAGTTTLAQELRTAVDQALARVLAEPTAVRAATAAGADPARAARIAADRSAVVDRLEVRTVTTGDRLFPEGTAGYDIAAPSQLVLFVFVTGLTGSAALIQVRQLGLARRMMATPTSVGVIIVGEALARLVIGLVQGTYILVAAVLLFGVAWGDPLGAAAVVLAVAAVSAAASMLFGAVFSDPDQASGVGTVVALALAALGGAMLPIELFSDTLASVARVTPHHWAISAFAELIRHDGTLLDIGRQLAVLAAFAAGLLAVATWRLRRVLVRPA